MAVGRRSDHSREQLYELALNAARDIIEAEGYRALTARNIADRIGYSAGTLYNLFENLDDLIVHINGRTLDDMYAGLAGAEMGADPGSNLRELLARYLDFIGKRRDLWALLFDHSLPAGQRAPDWYSRKIDKVISVLESALAPAFKPGDDTGPKHSARVLWASLHGICSLAESRKLDLLTSASATDMAHTLFDTYLAGLNARRGECSDHRPG